METLSTYACALLVLLALCSVLWMMVAWVMGLVACVWWSVTKVAELFKGRDEDIG
jgi:hypothetical protein